MSHRNFTWPSLPHSIPNLLLLCSLHQWWYNYPSSPKLKNLGIFLVFSLLSSVLPHLLQFLLILLLDYHVGSPASLHPLFHSDQVSITSFVVYENVLIIGFLAWSLAPCSHSSFTEETQRSIVLIHTSSVTPVLNGHPFPSRQSFKSFTLWQRPGTSVTLAKLSSFMSCLSSL